MKNPLLATAKDRVVTFDIEAIGLLPDLIEGDINSVHIIHVKDKYTGETFTFFNDFSQRKDAEWLDEYEDGYADGTLEEGVEFLRLSKVMIIQNGFGYDIPAIEKATGKPFKRNHFEATGLEKYPFKTMDTNIMSCLLNPERKVPHQAYAMGRGNVGPHSIEAHGIRIGRYKPDNEDWSHLTQHMIHRVEEDVEIGEDFYDYLWNEDWIPQSKRTNPSTGMNIKQAYWCEMRVANTIARQSLRGFAIDTPFIADMIEELDTKITTTYDAFRPHMPLRLVRSKRKPEKVRSDAMKLPAQAAREWLAEQEVMEFRGASKVTKWDLTKKNGEYTALVTKDFPEARGFMADHKDPLVAGAYTPIEFEEIPLGNRATVKELLYDFGWRGVNYNEKEREHLEDNGELPHPWSGKIDEDSMNRWAETGSVPDWCQGIAEWYILSSRRNQWLNDKDCKYFKENSRWPRQQSGKYECRGMLPRALLHVEGKKFGTISAQDYFEKHGEWPTEGHWRVPAQAFPIGTNTHRMRHRVVVNIPSRGLYGWHMRRAFIAGPDMLILGCDGSGLELRMLSHFMADAVYQDTVLNGDIHTYNQELAGLPTRDMAKTFIYAFLYGSGIPNLAASLGLPEHEMAQSVARFKRMLPKLARLLERVEEAGKKFGYLMAVDGRWGRIRRRQGQLALHTALNVLLQMTGSLTMKWGQVLAEDLAVEAGLIESANDFPIVAHVHDECQMEVAAADVESKTYWVTDWKAEEKAIHIDDEGRMWSAPRKTDNTTEDGQIEVIRRYHPLGEIYAKAIEAAGTKLGLRCPTAGEYMIGESWAETH